MPVGKRAGTSREGLSTGDVAFWSAPCPPIDAAKILRVHGYRDEGKVRPVIRKAAVDMGRRVPDLVEAKGCWRKVAVEDLSNNEIRLAGGARLSCPAFGRLLNGVPQVVVFVLTLGARFDEAVSGLSQAGEPLHALFLEAAGRLAVEKLTRVLAADIGKALRAEGLMLGPRLGPGYTYRMEGQPATERVDWPLEQQRELMSLFREVKLPIELLESAVMLPKMSRSGLFGVVRAE